MRDIMENMSKDQVFEALQKKYKSRIRRVNRKNHRIFFKNHRDALYVQGILFEKEIPHIYSGKVIRLTD